MRTCSALISHPISQSPVDGLAVNMGSKERTWNKTRTPGLLKHKSGRYYGRFTVGGKTRFEPLKTDLADIARIRFAEAKAKVERTRKAARNAAEGSASMGDLVVIARQRIAERTGISDRTRELNRDAIGFIERTWDGFAKLRPDEITPTVVGKWRDRALATGTGHRPPGSHAEKKGASASSVNKAISALSLMLDAAVDMGAIHGNPLARRRGLKASDKPHKPKLPEHADLERLFTEIESVGGKGTPVGEFCRFLAYTGCRKGEAALVRWQDVDFTRGVIRVRGTKTEAATREVPLIPAARALLERIRARREAINRKLNRTETLDPASSVLGVKEAQNSLNRACAKIGIPRLTHHDLRDAFATACIEAGVDIPTVAGWLGHVDGGALLMRVYAHHRRAHSVAQAAKVTFGAA